MQNSSITINLHPEMSVFSHWISLPSLQNIVVRSLAKPVKGPKEAWTKSLNGRPAAGPSGDEAYVYPSRPSPQERFICLPFLT
jgi:hypothetical protein